MPKKYRRGIDIDREITALSMEGISFSRTEVLRIGKIVAHV